MEKIKIVWPKKKYVMKEILLVATVSLVFILLTILGDAVGLLILK